MKMKANKKWTAAHHAAFQATLKRKKLTAQLGKTIASPNGQPSTEIKTEFDILQSIVAQFAQLTPSGKRYISERLLVKE
jgi:hypothetical protein